MIALPRNRASTAPAVLAGAALVLVGCGGGSDYANRARPPVPITVTAAILKDRVAVSPARFGAGPITLIVTNQTARSQDVTLETNESGATQAGIRQATGPINPQDTSQLKADVREGSYVVRVRTASIKPAQVTVGRARPSGQDKLLQP
jgi:hypothetical protein